MELSLTKANVIIKSMDNESSFALHFLNGPSIYSSQNANLSVTVDQTTSTSVTSEYASRPFLLSFWERIFWQILFAILVTISVWGNLIVMWIILAHRHMRTATNYFLLNLSVTDFIMATFNAIFNFIYMLDSHWPFGTVYCAVNNFISCVSVACSVFTMVAMSFDRYIAIVNPMSPRMSRKKAALLTICVWLASCLLSTPMLFYSATKTWTYEDGDRRTLCFLWWPDGVGAISTMNYMYNVAFLILTYVMPIFALIITYTAMCRVLWGNKGIGELTSRQLHSINCKKRVVRMFIAVVVIFILCWLPYHVLFIYSYHRIELMHTSYIQNLYLGCYWLAMSNSMYNPIIFYWMNKRFRMYFKTVLCCWKKLKDIPRLSRSFRWSSSKTSSIRKRFIKPTPCVELVQKDANGKEYTALPIKENGVNLVQAPVNAV